MEAQATPIEPALPGHDIIQALTSHGMDEETAKAKADAEAKAAED